MTEDKLEDDSNPAYRRGNDNARLEHRVIEHSIRLDIINGSIEKTGQAINEMRNELAAINEDRRRERAVHEAMVTYLRETKDLAERNQTRNISLGQLIFAALSVILAIVIPIAIILLNQGSTVHP